VNRVTSAICVDPQHVGKIWFRVRGLVAAALKRGSGETTIEEVEKELATGLMLLWLGMDGPTIISAGVTQLTTDGVCTLVAYGGRREDHLMETIESYARDEGCKKVRVIGREGWKRVLKQYRQPYIVLEKSI